MSDSSLPGSAEREQTPGNLCELSPVAADDPRMIAWNAYRTTEDYANTKRWAVYEEYTEGSLWAAFIAGFAAALASLKEQQAEQKELIEVWDAWAAKNLPDFGIPVSELWRREKQAEAHPETLMSSAQFFDELSAKLRLLSTSDSEQK